MDRSASSVHKAVFIALILLAGFLYTAQSAMAVSKVSYPTPAHIAKVSGDNQSGQTGKALPDPLTVQVRGMDNRPLSMAKVTFKVTEGGGKLTENIKLDPNGSNSVSVDTNYNGIAGITFILGLAKGTNKVEAIAGSVGPVTFTAIAVNSPPKLNPIGDRQIDENTTLKFTVSATDPDLGDTVTLSTSALPTNATFDPSTGVFTFTPDYGQSASYSITFAASDGSLTDSETITITVADANRPPVLDPIGNRTVNENTQLTIPLSASDPDGNALSFSGSGMPSGAVIQQQNGTQATFKWTPGYDAAPSGSSRNFSVTFTVSDSRGGIDSEQVTITVNDVVPPPSPDIRVAPEDIDFGIVKVGESADALFQIYNDGSLPLRISSITPSNSHFAILAYSQVDDQIVAVTYLEKDQRFTVTKYSESDPRFSSVDEAGQSITVTYTSTDPLQVSVSYPDAPPGGIIVVKARFTPLSGGPKQGRIMIASNDPDEPVVSVNVIGTAVLVPDIRVSPTSLNFGSVSVGTSSSQNLDIHNDGDAALLIHQIVTSDPQFTVSPYSNVNPLGKTTVAVKFTPASVGVKNATMSIFSNDPDEPVVNVSLQGTGTGTIIPDIRVSPTSLNFGEVNVGSTLEKDFQIYNDGNGLLEVSSITSSNSQFQVSAPSNVQPGGTITVQVLFKPTSAGAKTGVITITSNDPDEPTSQVYVEGTGKAVPVPDIRVSPASLDYGNTEVGQWLDKNFRIYNDGTALLDITSIISSSSQFIVMDKYDVMPGSMVEITVRFMPTSQGQKTGVITIYSNDPDEPTKTVSVLGTGIITLIPDIRVEPTSLDFGDVQMGQFLDKKFKIYNDGNVDLEVSSITSSNTMFAVLNKQNVPPGGMVEITIRFTPTSTGTKSGTITIYSNDPDEPVRTVGVQGKGIPAIVPDIRVYPTTLDFEDVQVGQSLIKYVYIYNDGNGLLEISSITSSDTQFVALDKSDVPAGGMKEVRIRFTPSSPGTKTGVITINSNDPDESPVLVFALGNGIPVLAPDIRVEPTSVDFGDVGLGYSKVKQFDIYNEGTATLIINSITSSNSQFVVLDSSNVPAGGMVEISVRFTPASLGTKTGVLTINSNDPDEPYESVYVEGKGIQAIVPDIRIQPISLDYGEVGVSQSLVKQFRIYNDGTATLVIDSITSSNSQFVVLNSPNVPAGGMADISVRFTPLSLGTKTGVITVNSNDPDESAEIVYVQGKGVSYLVPDIRVSPTSLDFGDVPLGLPVEEEFQIYNDGAGLLQISSIVSDSSRFVVLDKPDVQPGAVADVRVRFTPQYTGLYVGTITIYSNDPDEPTVSVNVQGRGTQAIPDIHLLDNTLDFGNVDLGLSSDEYFQVYNLGIGILKILNVTSNNNDFQVLDYPDEVNPGQSEEVRVRFTPSSLGVKSGTLTIVSNDPDEQSVTVSLYGVGAYPSIPEIGEWQTVQTSITNELRDVHFVNKDKGWVAGSSGTIAYSGDGGSTWTRQTTGTSRSFRGIYFVDSSRGWAVGQYGTLLRTTNGGLSWSSTDPGTLYELNGITFVSTTRGWIVGEDGIILTTSNGSTWTSQDSKTQRDLYGVSFANSYRGWAVGAYGTICYTNNGGSTWSSQQSGSTATLYAVDFVDSSRGWIVGNNGTILRTQDGGQTWTPQTNGVPYATLTDVHFLNSTQGWVVGQSGLILYTNDGGLTWLRVDSGTSNTLRAVYLTDADNGWAVGYYGTILKYSTLYVPVITSVTVSGSPAGVGGVITVKATGQRQCQAKFSITGVISNVAMTESPYGTYTGTYTVPEGVNATDAQVRVTLTNSYGNTAVNTSKTVTIDTIAIINWASVTPQVAKKGDTVQVTMGGEANGTAKFSIGTVVTDRAMTESLITPGSYTGTYTVSQGVDVENAKVIVKLTDSLQNSVTKEAGQITIDTSAQITSVSVIGSPAKFGEPIIVILIGESGGTANFSIAGVVSSVAMNEASSGIYTGSYTAPKGTYAKNAKLTVEFTDARGNSAVRYPQDVTIDTESRIDSVTVTGSPARTGDTITVTLTGEQYGTAKFSIAGFIEDVAMPELTYQRGKYIGRYTVGSEDPSFTNAILTVTLVDQAGNIGTDASQRVTIDTMSPEIYSVSVSGSPAKMNGAITVTMKGEIEGTAKFSIAGVVDNVSMEEAPSGTYVGSYTVKSYINATDAIVTVTLSDALGNASTDTSKRATIDTSAPQITSVSVSGSPAKAGGTIGVTMTGELGGAAHFSITGVVENVAMLEIAGQPGKYAGTYTVAIGATISVTNAILTVTLRDAAGNVSTNNSQRATIDTIPPQITSVSVAGSPAKAGGTITVTIVGEPKAKANFSISGLVQNVSMTEKTSQPGTYTGTYLVVSGANVTNATVIATLSDDLGNQSTDTSQRVTIDTTAPQITSVTVSGSPASLGETITVTMIGEPQGTAHFSIAGVVDNVAMTDDTSHTSRYVGKYTIIKEANITGAVLTVVLKDAAGNMGTDSSQKVTIRPSWDANRDGKIDVADFIVIGTYFGQAADPGNKADVNRDGRINLLDLIIMARHFGETATPSAPVVSPLKRGLGGFSIVSPEQLEILKRLYKSVQEAEEPGERGSEEVKELLADLIRAATPQVTESRLMQNYPNPCNPETWIPYALAEPGNVTIRIYSASGQLIRILDLGYKEMGSYADRDKAAHWDGENESGEKVSSGLYFYVIRSGEFTATRKMIVTR